MYSTIYLALLVYACGFSNQTTPPYIKPCNRGDRKCYIQHGNEVVKHIINGDKNLKLPSVNPMKIQQVSATARNLTLEFKDLEAYGLDTVEIADVDFNFETKKIYIELHGDHITLVGDYKVMGQFMIVPVKGNGAFNITFKNVVCKYPLNYKEKVVDAKHFAIIQPNYNPEVIVQSYYFKFENVVDGNQQMSDSVNKLLNENADAVIEEVRSPVNKVVRTISDTIFHSIFENIPLEELFLN